ncbi:hypothetical protein [Streptomyces silvisoli]|uniref:Relaxase/mobilization nuclease n=1 Tax=Streptomyces silvisoli TaxID=3034235 RepID=A0ABT5ZRF2_9ACTN|nr:hypothetical protein [Streptomyces silvisoli]MDF3292407.1 hypothetical protein [Streptomyces silvisoli]
MIARIHRRNPDAVEALAEALDRPVSYQESLTAYTVVAHWPGPDVYSLNAPSRQHPSPFSPQDDGHAIWHADVRLHPGDRDLNRAEWSEIAHRLARTAGIHRPGDGSGCRWIAVQAQPGRLDLMANLIRADGTWQQQPHKLDLVKAMTSECRRIEADFALTPPHHNPVAQIPAQPVPAHTRDSGEPTAHSTEQLVGTTAQLAELLHQLADEATGPVATVRGLVEHAAYRLNRLPRAYGPASGHQLELIARRLHGMQQDLEATAAALHSTSWSPARPAPAVASHPQTARARVSR